MPDRITNKSRNVGTRKPGRPPKSQKTDAAPSQPPATYQDSQSTNSETDWSSEFDNGIGTLTVTTPTEIAEITTRVGYKGLEQVPHGLNITRFDANAALPTDLTVVSSSLAETSQADAEKAVQQIQGQRQTMRVVNANIGLSQDIGKAAIEDQKLEGVIIDFATAKQNNVTKYVNYLTAGVQTAIAVNKLEQSRETLVQGRTVLTGMKGLTPLILEEWTTRQQLKRASINNLKTKIMENATQGDFRLNQTLEATSRQTDE